MDPFKLIFVGSLIKLKNVDILVKAFLQLQKHTSIHFQLHLIGEGPLHGQLKRLIRDLKAEDSVFLWGAQPQASVARLIAEAHVLILPSKEETFGIVLIEAMACGIPVIATRTGGAGELVNKDRGLLIDSKNEGDLIEAIQKMYSQYHQYAPEKIRAFAAEKFGFKVVGNQLMELYRSLTDQ